METNALPVHRDRSVAGVSRSIHTAIVWALMLLLADPGRGLAGAPEPDFEPEELESLSSPSTPVMSVTPPPPDGNAVAAVPRPVLDPSARLLKGDDASEAWTLFVQLESGHRITQRFLLANAGPGRHNGVAVGHLTEPGRAPYRYQNGRRRPRWTLSEDRLFFDIGASHLDLHRPKGELRITKDDIEIRLFFDFAEHDISAQIPESRLPPGYHVEVLAVGAPTRGSIHAPWMSEALETRGHTWLVHTWTNADEAALLTRRVEVFGRDSDTVIYGMQLIGPGDWESAWALRANAQSSIIDSSINVSDRWIEGSPQAGSKTYPTPSGFVVEPPAGLGPISLGSDWLRFDPLEVIPQPFRWFIRRMSKPQEVWADAQIGVSISPTPDPPSLPAAGTKMGTGLTVQAQEGSRSKREIEDEAAERSVTGVASITFLNPMKRR